MITATPNTISWLSSSSQLLLFLLAVTTLESTALHLNLTSLTPVYASTFWSLCYMSHAFYVLLWFSAVLYLLPNLASFSGVPSRLAVFSSIESLSLAKFFFTPLFELLLVHSAWSGPSVTSWFGHVLFSYLQYKVSYILFFFFASYLLVLLMVVHYANVGSYDFTLTLFHFFFWIWISFFANNLFTFVFFLEILSTLIMLMLVTSTFSSTTFYNTLSYTNNSYFQVSTPNAFFQTLLFFFWITLVSSLLLFSLLTAFYLQLFTFDWNLVDLVVTFYLSVSTLKTVFSVSFVSLVFMVCIFVKCGVAPFYFWKPTFFKGMTVLSLFFYVYVYYFALFLYLLCVIFLYLNELFILNMHIIILLLTLAILVLSILLFDSFYLKAFLALSSILNSAFLLLATCSQHSADVLFLL